MNNLLGKKKIKIKKEVIYIAIAVVLVGILVGFFLLTNSKKDQSENTNTPNNTNSNKIQIVNVDSTSRPFAIMINNHPAARPYHSGLQDAYITYELVVEGGYTRYMSLFKDQSTQRIGSVRSARHDFLDYALEHDAYYVHWGWSPQAKNDIQKGISGTKINNINGLSDNAFYRDNNLKIALEHRGITDMAKLNKSVANLKYRTETNRDLLFTYSFDSVDLSKVENNKNANKVAIKYSGSVTSSYIYDEVSKTYKRYVNDKEHIDYVTKNQYTVKNIITYQVKNSSLDSAGRQDIDTVGSGKGYYITNGVAVPITWEKNSRTAQTIYKYESGEEIILNDGNTFIQIQPVNQSLVIE